MKIGPVIAATLLGLAIGIPVALRMAGRVARPEPAPVVATAPPPEPPAGFSLQAVVEQRDLLPVIKSARDFMDLRRDAADRTGSPYRASAREKAALAQLPLGELIALLEAGELHDLNEAAAAFQRWVETDPSAAYKKMLQLPLTTDQRHVARSMIFAHWAKTDPERMLGLLEKLPEGERKDVDAQYFLSVWQQENPGQALRFLDRLAGLAGFGTDAEKIGEDLLEAWMAKDKEAASRWLEALPPGETKDALKDAMEAAHLSQMPLAKAVKWVREHPDQMAAQKRLPEILRNWATSEPAAVLAQLSEFPENHPVWAHEAASVAQSAMVTAAMSKQTEFLTKTVNDLPEGPAKRKLLLGLIRGATSGDFALARRLFAGLSESREREQAASWLSETLSRKDPVAAGEWLLGLDPSPSRDAATGRFAATLAADQPEFAAEWADSIADPDQAAGARHVVHAKWRERDPQAADQWRSTWAGAGDEGD